MKFTQKSADKILCDFIGINLQNTLNYDTLFTIIDLIEETKHPKWPDYTFVFNMDSNRIWINIGINTNGLDGYFNELFPTPDFRIDAIRKVVFEWIVWYKNSPR
jgi:hypothetical protein